jgi:hypothetical protein
MVPLLVQGLVASFTLVDTTGLKAQWCEESQSVAEENSKEIPEEGHCQALCVSCESHRRVLDLLILLEVPNVLEVGASLSRRAICLYGLLAEECCACLSLLR